MTGDEVPAEEAIIAEEKRALDRWAAGDPVGYIDGAAPDVTSFDDIGANERIDGREANVAYAKTLEGQIPVHDYEISDPRVQLFGDVGVLTFRYLPSLPGEDVSTIWKATTVYRRSADEGSDDSWQKVHAHWSLVKTS